MKRKKTNRKIAVYARKTRRGGIYGGAWVPEFLANLARTGNVTISAMAAGIERKTAQIWHKENAEFAAAWSDAAEQSADLIKAEIRRRAVDGVDEPVTFQGQQTFIAVDRSGKVVPSPLSEEELKLFKKRGGRVIPFTIKRYSDGLLQFLAKSARPSEFRDNVHHTSDGSFSAKPAVEGTELVCTAPAPKGSALPHVPPPGIPGEE